MTSMPTPTPTPANPLGHLPSITVHSLWHGVWTEATSSPIAGTLAVLAVIGAVIGAVRWLLHTGDPRDPTRRFSRADKATILARAGGRCEHHTPLIGRCRETQGLEADHVHPWSRGGQTSVANAQSLCRAHNRIKRARVPYGWQLRTLAKRRTGYFPDGISGTVTRRAVRTRARRS